MDRRTFLGLSGAGFTTLAGCMATGSPADKNCFTQPITDFQFALVDSEEPPKSTKIDFEKRFQHAVNVHFISEEFQIIIEGRLKSGGRSCKKTVLESACYDEESDTLTVIVFDDRDESAGVCTTETAVVPYKATISFDSMLPENVVVKHREDGPGIKFKDSFSQ
ncbi:hypothetical protein [Natrinema halophilum]|uniref:hypothetical protein n=1 Tax=Natrinema halophilum TaxID=1699371 RepID=UPI001C5288B3|nr:hypothetical protein [Natrinema halophilum]UHQ96034.1 hypothetical protein HYG82_02740 [Natrinema halophilum]